jgi:hypothetical protein
MLYLNARVQNLSTLMYYGKKISWDERTSSHSCIAIGSWDLQHIRTIQ